MKYALQKGMTLMELLIAISLLTVMMTLIGMKIGQVLKTTEQMQAQTQRLETINIVFSQLSRELQQLADRPVNSGFQSLPALIGDESSIEFTHNGKTNQLAITQNSNLQRVKYTVGKRKSDDDQQEIKVLYRKAWLHLDRELEEEGEGIAIAEGFESLSFEYLDPDTGSWQTLWSSSPAASLLATPLPLAIKVTMVMPGVGKIDRSFLIPRNRFQ